MTRLYLFRYQASAAHPADRTGLAGRRRGDSTVKAVRRRPVAATDAGPGRAQEARLPEGLSRGAVAGVPAEPLREILELRRRPPGRFVGPDRLRVPGARASRRRSTLASQTSVSPCMGRAPVCTPAGWPAWSHWPGVDADLGVARLLRVTPSVPIGSG
jgi:hypothetical protein